MVNLAGLEEMACPNCGRPYVAESVDGTLSALRFLGCRCDDEQFDLPEAVGCVGIEGGLMFFVRKRQGAGGL